MSDGSTTSCFFASGEAVDEHIDGLAAAGPPAAHVYMSQVCAWCIRILPHRQTHAFVRAPSLAEDAVGAPAEGKIRWLFAVLSQGFGRLRAQAGERTPCRVECVGPDGGAIDLR